MSTAKTERRLDYPPSIDKIRERLYLGNITSLLNQDTLKEHNIGACISLIQRPLAQWEQEPVTQYIHAHKFVKCADSLDENILHHLGPCCDFIHEQRRRVRRKVLVHCQMGRSRSAVIVIAYFMKRYGVSVDSGLKEVRKHRPQINPNANFLRQLRAWEEMDYNIWEDEEKKIPKPQYITYVSMLDVTRRVTALEHSLGEMRIKASNDKQDKATQTD